MNMLVLIIILLILVESNQCANIYIEPQRVLLNTSSSTKLICTKEKSDHQDFDVYLSNNISTNYIQITTNYLNDTTIEINIQSFNQIGRFSLVCSSKGNNNHATIIISKPPGLLVRAEPCIVYYGEYIDCILRAPVIVQAIQDSLNYTFNFTERRLLVQPIVYRRNPQLVNINPINKTLTFRWIPNEPGRFPLDFKMIVYATITNFGTTNHILDMTPIFRISSNFTTQILSSTDLRVDFMNQKVICHGNLTRMDQVNPSNQRENLRTFNEFNFSTIHVTSLRPDTSYRLCFHCRHHESIRSVSDIECQVYRTFKAINFSVYDSFIAIIFFFLCVVITTHLMTRCNCNKIFRFRNNAEHNNQQVIELKVFIPSSNR